MPTKGKCCSCGETAILHIITVRNIYDRHMECWMVCAKCKRFYEERMLDAEDRE